MKKLLLLIAVLTASLASAQNYNFNIGGLQYASGSSAPGSCNRAGSYFFKNSATTGWYVCQGGVYVAVASSGGGTPPGGSNTDLQYNNAGAFGGFTDGASTTVLHGGRTFSQVTSTDVDSTIALASQLPQANPVPGTSTLLTGGGVAWTGGLTFIVAPATYSIAGVSYSSVQTTLTLGTADPSNPRIDVIAVDSTGTAIVIAGTPAATPAAPNVDPNSQLQLTFALVAAGATTPSSLTETDIYLENTEWTCAATANLNCASTNNPYAGTKDIEATSAVATNNVVLTKPSTTLKLSDYNNLVFYIQSKAAWPAAKSLAISWLNGTTVVGTSVGLKTGVFGFSSTNTSSYQQIVIPVSAFAAGTNNVSKLKIQVAGGGAAIGYYIDNIFLQGGVTPPPVAQPTMLFRGAYSTTSSYNPNDIVTSNGQSYVNLVGATNVTPLGNATTWQPVVSTLTVAAGGTGTGSTLTGLVRGSSSAMTAAELSGDCTTSGSNAVTCSGLAPKASPTFTGTETFAPKIATTTNCAASGTAANPSVASCSASLSGAFACATNASTGTCTVNTTAVTTNSRIFVQPNAGEGANLSVTCNTTADTGLVAPRIASKSNGTSFTINLGTFATNPLCFDYWVVN